MAACAPSLERQLWTSAQAADTVPAYRGFLQRYPQGARAVQARRRLEQLRSSAWSLHAVHLVVIPRYTYGSGALELEGVDLPVCQRAAAVLAWVPLAVEPEGSGSRRGEAGAGEELPTGGPGVPTPERGVLELRFEGRALHQGYAPAVEGRLARRVVTRQYAAVRLRGSAVLRTVAGTAYARDFEGQTAPPARLGAPIYASPREAPFDQALDKVLVPEAARLVAVLYGPEPLVRGLRAEVLALRLAAARILGEEGEAEAVRPLVETLAGTANFALQAACVRALGQLGDARAAGPVARALGTSFDRGVRVEAARALGRIGAPASVPALLAALDDAVQVREAAARALRRITGTDDPAGWRSWTPPPAAPSDAAP